MTQEIQVRGSLLIRNPTNGSGLYYQSQPQGFTANQTTDNGPTPGTINAVTTSTGTQIVLSSLTTPGLAFFQNLDPTNYVTIGLVVSGVFYPFQELKPGEFYYYRLSRTILSAAGLWILANTAACRVRCDVFDA